MAKNITLVTKDELKTKAKINYVNELPATAVEDEYYATPEGTQETLQLIYDVFNPIGTEHLGMVAPVVPTGITATWTEDTTFSGRYLKLSSSTAGTLEAEELPLPEMNDVAGHTHTTDSQGNHNHDRGDMNIYGRAGMLFPKAYSPTEAIRKGDQWGGLSSGIWGDNSPDQVVWGEFNASNNWTGHTNTTGAHNHTAQTAGAHTPTAKETGAYKTGGSVKPLTVTIKRWTRTA